MFSLYSIALKFSCVYIICEHFRYEGLLHAKSGQVVLAGDPKQLGPIIRSPFAAKYGMGTTRRPDTRTVLYVPHCERTNGVKTSASLLCAGVSLLERLMKDFPLYQKNDNVFDNRYVTKLLHNYRSGSRGHCRPLGEINQGWS